MTRWLAIGGALLLVLAALWFLGVDRSWFVEECRDCGFGRDIGQYRVFGLAVHERVRSHHTLVERLSVDLGVPCEHPHLNRWHRQRWWGLCICAWPKIKGTVRIIGDLSWYNETVSGRAKAIARADPGAGQRFRERVLLQHDMEYLQEFVKTLGDGDELGRRLE